MALLIVGVLGPPVLRTLGRAALTASIMVLSPTNQLLLLHRVQTSTSFPSAHVFPGGNLSKFHEGNIPEPDDPARHRDGHAYRLGAIRETFEEAGILLAKPKNGGDRLLELPEAQVEDARKTIHGNKVRFTDWVDQVGGVPDLGELRCGLCCATNASSIRAERRTPCPVSAPCSVSWPSARVK